MKTITIDEIIKKLFGDGETPDWGTPASDIYEYQFELEVTVEDADWIENDGWGCSRPNQDYENEDLTKKEIIKVNADSLIKSEFREDFIAHLYTEDLKNGEITIEELEKWINSSIQNCITFFNNFTVADTESSGAPNDIYVNIQIGKKYSLEDLNPDWKDEKYNVTGFNDMKIPTRTHLFGYTK
jgi:hypothetical protein